MSIAHDCASKQLGLSRQWPPCCKGVVNEVPYKKNIPTAPAFVVADRKNFEEEKSKLIKYLEYTVSLGKDHFEGKESLSFGSMTALEWNNLFYKHLDHHLNQFGV